jgi:glutamate decarboxylase
MTNILSLAPDQPSKYGRARGLQVELGGPAASSALPLPHLTLPALGSGKGSSAIPEGGCSAAAVYRHIHDELQLDGQPHLNVASFVTTWMETEAEQLSYESINKNLVNAAEYTRTELIHQQVITMTASLFHADIPAGACEPGEDPGMIGTTTVGSSEAVMLALLAHKWNWKQKRDQRPGHTAKDRPYLIIGTHTHACFAKFGRYCDVEVKWVSLQPGVYAITAEQVRTVLETKIADDPQVMETCGFTLEEAGERRVGELVMAVGCVACTTYTGDIDDVEGINQVLVQGGWDIPIHVDAASGGFILPFTEAMGAAPPLWDFRLARVQSINVSNHKYGLVYPGLGTVVFRNATVVPEELLVNIDYLGGEIRNFSLNFSRASTGVIVQYYNFLRLGKAGYRRVIQGCLDQAQYLANAIESSPTLEPYFDVISKTAYFPIVAIRFKDNWLDQPPFTLAELEKQLEATGWFAPVYNLPPDNDRIEVMRIVVRAHFNRALASTFLHDLEAAVQRLTPAASRITGAPSLCGNHLQCVSRIRRQPSGQQTDGEEATHALDARGCSPPAAGPHPHAQRQSGVHLPRVVPGIRLGRPPHPL